MNRIELQSMLLACVRDVQEMCGKAPPALALDTCPFTDLEGFDSLTAVEATGLLSQRLGKKIRCGKDEINLFVSKDGRTPLKLLEVVDRMESLVER
ncbi:MAG: acyl carrier protein [Opitutales bacterium]